MSSRASKSMQLSQLSDITLGAFRYAPSPETVDHLVRYLSTWSGSDKALMIIEYSIRILVPFLRFRARMQHKAGMRKNDISSSAVKLSKLTSLISDSRMLWRFGGLLPIYQWLTSLERVHPPTRKLLTIERLQGWSMLAYYPLEHLYYLCSHSVLDALPGVGALDTAALGIWSTRFWAAYVFLQFMHLKEDRRLLKLRQVALSKKNGKAKAGHKPPEQVDLEKRRDALLNELVVNLGYLPLTIHWSLAQGLFKHEIWVGIFGLLAGLASFRSGWKATALPTPTSDASPDVAQADANLPIRD